MKIIDAHIHLWDIDQLNYPWLANVPAIDRTYLFSDYDEARGEADVEAVVFVQSECRPDQYLKELNWVKLMADRDSRLQAIVPWAPLEEGEAVGEVLRAIAADSRVKGVRRIIEFEDDIDFCIRPGFVRGVQLLGEVGLHCELTVGPRNFPNLMKLVEATPDTRFILDHIGCPNIAEGQLQPWKNYLRAFASSGPHPCKLSNLVCNADLENWKIEDLRPFADAVIEIFGPDRIIWASDWPHALRASSWQRWFETAQALTAELGGDAQQKIFHDNAKSFYLI